MIKKHGLKKKKVAPQSEKTTGKLGESVCNTQSALISQQYVKSLKLREKGPKVHIKMRKYINRLFAIMLDNGP